MKTCKECGHTKEFSEFAVHNRMKDGFVNHCKSCINKQQIGKRQTKKGLVANIYSTQKQTSKRRGHTPPTYTLYGLRQWFKSNAAANALYDAWVLSGYAKNLRPSVDRLDDSKGYSIGNIQLMTWGENNAKSHSDRVSGKMKKCSNKAVIQMDLNGNFIAEYHSTREAERATGTNNGNISSCCSGKVKTAGGFQWKFERSLV